MQMYRAITRACKSGIKHFMKTKMGEEKEEAMVREIIELTRGQYGNNTLEQYFSNKGV